MVFSLLPIFQTQRFSGSRQVNTKSIVDLPHYRSTKESHFHYNINPFKLDKIAQNIFSLLNNVTITNIDTNVEKNSSSFFPRYNYINREIQTQIISRS